MDIAANVAGGFSRTVAKRLLYPTSITTLIDFNLVRDDERNSVLGQDC